MNKLARIILSLRAQIVRALTGATPDGAPDGRAPTSPTK
jgi:hypothetical protein